MKSRLRAIGGSGGEWHTLSYRPSDDLCRKCFHHPESSRTPQFPFSFSLFQPILPTDPRQRPRPPQHRTRTHQRMLSTRLAAAARLRPAFAHLLSSSASSKATVPAEAQPVPAVVPQSPNHAATWSANQRPRPAGQSGPRFEQTAMELQPNPLSAMELIANEPTRVIHGRKAVCDGGKSTTIVNANPARTVLIIDFSPSPPPPFFLPFFLLSAGAGPLGHPKIYINLVRVICLLSVEYGANCSLSFG